MQCQQAPSWSRLAQPQFKSCIYLSLSVNGSVHSFLAYRQCRTLRPRTLCCYSQYKLLLYTKPECPLCNGLKDKVQALIDRAEFMPSSLTGTTLEVRDISTNEDWQDAMHLSVPVLAVLDAKGQEVVLPRPQPRITADRLQRHLQEALAAVDVDV